MEYLVLLRFAQKELLFKDKSPYEKDGLEKTQGIRKSSQKFWILEKIRYDFDDLKVSFFQAGIRSMAIFLHLSFQLALLAFQCIPTSLPSKQQAAEMDGHVTKLYKCPWKGINSYGQRYARDAQKSMCSKGHTTPTLKT